MYLIKFCVKMLKKFLYKLFYFKYKIIKNFLRIGKSNNCLIMILKLAVKKRRFENSFLISWLRKFSNFDVIYEEENNNEVLEVFLEILILVFIILVEFFKLKIIEFKKRKIGFCKIW